MSEPNRKKITFDRHLMTTYDPKKPITIQLEDYLYFERITYHISQEFDFPESTNDITKENIISWIDNAESIELHCSSDDKVKFTFEKFKNALLEYHYALIDDYTTNLKVLESDLKAQISKCKYNCFKRDINSVLFFSSGVLVQFNNGKTKLVLGRYEFELGGDEYLKNYIGYNIRLRKEFFENIAITINEIKDEVSKKINNMNYSSSDGVSIPNRVILEFIEMLKVEKFITDLNVLDKVESILSNLLVDNANKYSKDKSDYHKRIVNKFDAISKIFEKLKDQNIASNENKKYSQKTEVSK